VPRAVKPQVGFADWELLQQGILLEPLLQSISDFLDDHKEMIEVVRRDLEQGLKNPATGRGGQRNVRAAIERIIEKAGEVEVTASAVVGVVQAYAKINANGQWVDQSQQVNLNELFHQNVSERAGRLRTRRNSTRVVYPNRRRNSR
jgi:hypothetical protein